MLNEIINPRNNIFFKILLRLFKEKFNIYNPSHFYDKEKLHTIDCRLNGTELTYIPDIMEYPSYFPTIWENSARLPFPEKLYYFLDSIYKEYSINLFYRFLDENNLTNIYFTAFTSIKGRLYRNATHRVDDINTFLKSTVSNLFISNAFLWREHNNLLVKHKDYNAWHEINRKWVFYLNLNINKKAQLNLEK